eukprot:CAMPEP_0168576934 /NCGR_PEP_ID=MMETSP0413-20121227/20516_1 /TAXON_ID=136452 /ORGANISM="Filamoeba nolandi, Strain NC-AS-23-1" /LENGTH=650 /DNA_ID=CAMNT_0008610651 /DNA_START=53 /DNA_END=2002 /DNA_ORIENTATION=-
MTSQMSSQRTHVDHVTNHSSSQVNGSRATREVVNHDQCDSCGDGGDLLCCDNCPCSFHFECVNPPINPNDLKLMKDWYCNTCRAILQPKPPPPTSVLSPLFVKLDSTNPEVFSLPQEIKNSVAVEPQASQYWDFNTNSAVDMSDDIRSKKKKTKLACTICCMSNLNQSDTVFCSICGSVFHMYCLEPPLIHKPTGAWYCPKHKDADMLPDTSFRLDFSRTREPESSYNDGADHLIGLSQSPQIARNNFNSFVENEIHQLQREQREAMLSALPTGTQPTGINNFSPSVMSQLTPLFTQFLAWQRLMQITQQVDQLQSLYSKYNRQANIHHNVHPQRSTAPQNTFQGPSVVTRQVDVPTTERLQSLIDASAAQPVQNSSSAANERMPEHENQSEVEEKPSKKVKVSDYQPISSPEVPAPEIPAAEAAPLLEVAPVRPPSPPPMPVPETSSAIEGSGVSAMQVSPPHDVAPTTNATENEVQTVAAPIQPPSPPRTAAITPAETPTIGSPVGQVVNAPAVTNTISIEENDDELDKQKKREAIWKEWELKAAGAAKYRKPIASLVSEDGQHKFDMRKQIVFIGRQKGWLNPIDWDLGTLPNIKANVVSRHHACVEYLEEHNIFKLTNLARNGTKVGDVMVSKLEGEHYISDGTEI